MRSLLKKRSEKGPPASVQPRWHPNFRNPARLPDVKVVRTTFFVNFIAVAALAGTGLLFFYNEYRLYGLSASIRDWETQIAQNTAASDEAVGKFRKFLEHDARLQEVKTFLTARFQPTQLLVELARTLPDPFVLKALDLQAQAVLLRGFAAGEAEQASGLLSTYVATLRTDPWCKKHFATIETTAVNRDSSGRLNFEIALRFPAPAPAPKPSTPSSPLASK